MSISIGDKVNLKENTACSLRVIDINNAILTVVNNCNVYNVHKDNVIKIIK